LSCLGNLGPLDGNWKSVGLDWTTWTEANFLSLACFSALFTRGDRGSPKVSPRSFQNMSWVLSFSSVLELNQSLFRRVD